MILISGTIYFSSCTDKNPTTGTLGITVIYNTGLPVDSYNLLYLATSMENLQNKIFSDSAQLDNTGKARFLYLLPNTYWYKVQNWKNFGSILVNAGTDSYTTLEVTEPGHKK